MLFYISIAAIAVTQAKLSVAQSPTEIYTGLSHACVLLDNGQMKCWGDGREGQLCYGDPEIRGDEPNEMGDNLPFVSFGDNRSVVQASVYDNHGCALLDNGKLKCWGRNDHGQLGYGDLDNRGNTANSSCQVLDLGSSLNIRKVTVGARHSCVLFEDSSIKCWGSNGLGQLGLGQFPLEEPDNLGDESNEMGTALPFVDYGGGGPIVDLVTGSYHNCILFTTGRIKCWGAFFGYNTSDFTGNAPNQMGANLKFVELGFGLIVQNITAGVGSTCALFTDGRLKCWGSNVFGQLGVNDTNDRGDASGEMGNDLPYVYLGDYTVIALPKQIAQHSCAILSDQGTKCWGRNDNGRLGLGDTEHRGDEDSEMGDFLPFVDFGPRFPIKLSLGRTNCALFNDSTINCWGRNEFGGLGIGNTSDRGGSSFQMGSNLTIVEIMTTNSPTKQPTKTPSRSPTNSPTKNPTKSPTNSPTTNPSNAPTKSPTKSPTDSPTNQPTNLPTNSPTKLPTNAPTNQPSNSPTKSPTKLPTTSPSSSPSKSPVATTSTNAPNPVVIVPSPTTDSGDKFKSGADKIHIQIKAFILVFFAVILFQ